MDIVARQLAVMGTAFALAVSAPARETALEASEAAVRAVESAESLLSTWRDDTPLARLNAAAPGAAVAVPADLFSVLKKVFEWRERTGGAFDPTVAPLVRAWGLRSGGRIPDALELLRARAATNVSLFAFGESSLRISRLDALSGIDEGAWGKGWALDRAAEAARAGGASSFVLDLGGQVLVDGEARSVAVAHPCDRSRTVATLRLRDASASTSGNSERGLVAGGRHIGHIVDPRTGEPAPDFGSATVVAPSALVADVLSTAFFVLGPEDGMALSGRLRERGVDHETLFLFEGKGGTALRASVSPGMKALLERTGEAAPRSRPVSRKSLEGATP